jgi:hypothetical protein
MVGGLEELTEVRFHQVEVDEPPIPFLFPSIRIEERHLFRARKEGIDPLAPDGDAIEASRLGVLARDQLRDVDIFPLPFHPGLKRRSLVLIELCGFPYSKLAEKVVAVVAPRQDQFVPLTGSSDDREQAHGSRFVLPGLECESHRRAERLTVAVTRENQGASTGRDRDGISGSLDLSQDLCRATALD